jgi:hypothetical protein
MTEIENTSKRNPIVHLAAGFPGSGTFANCIEDQEAAGQSQLVNSEMLPRDGSDGYATVGVTVVDDSGDDLFVKVTLPAGWSKRPTDHSMLSEVVDDLGRKRIGVFYKSAFYDRKAHGVVETVTSYVRSCVDYDRPVVTDDVWATPTAVAEAATVLARSSDKKAVEADELAASRGSDTYWIGRAAERRAEAAKYRTIAERYAASTDGSS